MWKSMIQNKLKSQKSSLYLTFSWYKVKSNAGYEFFKSKVLNCHPSDGWVCSSYAQQLQYIWHEGVKHPYCYLELEPHVEAFVGLCLKKLSSLLTLQHSRDSRWLLGDTRKFTQTQVHRHRSGPLLREHNILLTLQSEDSRRNTGSNYEEKSINLPVRNSTPPRAKAPILTLHF